MATSPLSLSFAIRPIATPRCAPLLLPWLPVALFTALFGLESSKWLGADHTSTPLQTLFQSIFGPAVAQHWTTLHHLIRKTGHFLGYGTFSLICFRTLWSSLRSSFTSHHPLALACHSLAITITFSVAGLDEIHQSFLPNRTGAFSDVLLDTSGAVLLQTLLFLAFSARQTISSRQPACTATPAYNFDLAV